MNKEYARKDINTSDIVARTENDMQSPVDKTIVHDAPVGELIADETGVSKSILDKAPIGESFPHEAAVITNDGSSVALINREESDHFRTRWNEIQGKFVDEPRAAVQQADALVSEVIGQLTQMFANEHTSLEGQWKQGKEVSTEDLRQALLRYHSFFNRLVV
jgi:hypothetical protein